MGMGIGIGIGMIPAIGNSIGNSSDIPPVEGPVILTQDNFSRDDDPLNLGATSNGLLWNEINGTWGIMAGEAYLSSQGYSDSAAYVNVGAVNIRITLDARGYGSQAGVSMKVIDANNRYLVTAFDGGTRLYRCMGGSWTILSEVPFDTEVDLTYKFKVDIVGDNFKIYINDLLYHDYVLLAEEMAIFESVTTAGMFIDSGDNTVRLDNFKVEEL